MRVTFLCGFQLRGATDLGSSGLTRGNYLLGSRTISGSSIACTFNASCPPNSISKTTISLSMVCFSPENSYNCLAPHISSVSGSIPEAATASTPPLKHVNVLLCISALCYLRYAILLRNSVVGSATLCLHTEKNGLLKLPGAIELSCNLACNACNLALMLSSRHCIES